MKLYLYFFLFLSISLCVNSEILYWRGKSQSLARFSPDTELNRMAPCDICKKLLARRETKIICMYIVILSFKIKARLLFFFSFLRKKKNTVISVRSSSSCAIVSCGTSRRDPWVVCSSIQNELRRKSQSSWRVWTAMASLVPLKEDKCFFFLFFLIEPRLLMSSGSSDFYPHHHRWCRKDDDEWDQVEDRN